MAAELFTSTMAKALKQITEALIGEEDPAYAADQRCRWLDLLRATPQRDSYINGEWDEPPRCECGSGSNAVGPAHSHWCQCHG